MIEKNLLSVLIFLPMLAAFILALPVFSEKNDQGGTKARVYAIIVSLFCFALSLIVLQRFDVSNPGYQLVENYDWIISYGITYALGIDGISLFLVLLTTLLMPIICLASCSVEKGVRGYLFNMLVLETAMLGTLLALDVFLFYVFWELMLAPMYFLIGIWGGKRRIYATLKFVLYTVVGSLLMLIAIFYVVWKYQSQFGVFSFALADLLKTTLSFQEELWLFAAFALAFGIKVPIFPFHTWLPDAHVEAPTGGSVVLAGVLLKMGIYGFIRFAYPLFPRAAMEFAPYIAVLAMIGIVYGALVAWAQTDIKKLVAYSSVSHLGYCVLGLVAFDLMSSVGSIYQMLNHGVTTGALFLLVGVLYDRRHTRAISEYGGIASQMPIFAFLFLVFTFSSIALPLTNGFIGEFFILLGSFHVFPLITAISVSGVVLGAIYMLTLYMQTMFGELNQEKNGALKDVSLRELTTFVPLFILVFWMGIFPQPFLSRIEPAVSNYITLVNDRKEVLRKFEVSQLEQKTKLTKLADEAVSVKG